MTDPSTRNLSGSAPGGESSPLFDNSIPLGGVTPSPVEPTRTSSRRHLILAMALFIVAVAAGKASTMPWRDYVWQSTDRVIETGWTRETGELGRGWLTMILAMAVASAGLLIATARERSGRILAVASGIGLMVLATVEWGVAGADSSNGPGTGLWLQLIAGAAAVLAVGIVPPEEHLR